MLRYLGHGQRTLGDYPMPPHKRVNWEFFAVIRGKCAPFFSAKQRPEVTTDTLWLFPPDFAHGWLGCPGETCEVVVLHFNSVPTAVERTVREQGYLAARLKTADIRSLTRIATSLKSHYWHPVLLSDIVADHALMEVSLLIMREVEGARRPRLGENSKLNRVLTAERWLSEHLAEQPSIVEAARSTGISPSQLRRLFEEIRKDSPKNILQKLKFERAMALMSQSDAKLQSIAAECGFSSASNFCRAFKSLHGSSPTAWRKEIHIQYKKPPHPDKENHLSYGYKRTPS